MDIDTKSEYDLEDICSVFTKTPKESILALLFIFQYCKKTDSHLDSVLPGGSGIRSDNTQPEKFRIALRELLGWGECYIRSVNHISSLVSISKKLLPYLQTRYHKSAEGFNNLLFRGIVISENKISPLHLAAACSDPAYIEILLSQDGIKRVCDVNVQSSVLQTPLHISALYNKFENANSLISFGYRFDIEHEDVYSRTPLSYAIEKGSHRMVKLFLQRGADPNYSPRDAPALIPLNLAINTCDIQILNLLLEHGADPNFDTLLTSDKPLYRAIENSSKAFVESLLRYHADANIPKCNALHYAINCSRWKLIESILPFIKDLDQTYKGENVYVKINKTMPERNADLVALKQKLLTMIQDQIRAQHDGISGLSSHFSRASFLGGHLKFSMSN